MLELVIYIYISSLSLSLFHFLVPPRTLTVLLTYDDPECGGAADAFVDQLEKEVTIWKETHRSRVCSVPIHAFPVSEGGEQHDDVLRHSLQALPSKVIVFSFLKGHAPQEYMAVQDVCRNTATVLAFHILTHLANFEDVGLVLRNLIRIVMHHLEKSAEVRPPSRNSANTPGAKQSRAKGLVVLSTAPYHTLFPCKRERMALAAWLRDSLAASYITSAPKPSGASPAAAGEVYGIVAANSWYDAGVVFDWTGLHRRLRGSSSAGVPLGEDVAALESYGAAQLRELGEGNCVATVIEFSAPWELQPLDAEAAQLSTFAARAPDADNAPAAELSLYAFTRGPAGLEPVMKDVNGFLRSLESQLQQQQIRVKRFLSSLVIFESDVTQLLHRTAAVHKAVTGAGLKLDGNRSNLAPHPVLRLGSKHTVSWAMLPLKDVSSDEDVVTFVVDLFFQWLQDSHDWRCLQPVKAFGTDDAKERRLQLFLLFVDTTLRPRLQQLGFPALTELLEVDFEDFKDQCSQQLQKKRKLVGPQKWTTLDLRLVLCQLDTFSLNPVTLFTSGMEEVRLLGWLLPPVDSRTAPGNSFHPAVEVSYISIIYIYIYIYIIISLLDRIVCYAADDRYHHVVYQVLRHRPQVVLPSIDEDLLHRVVKELRGLVAPHEKSSSTSRRATPLKQHDNGSRVVSADHFVSPCATPQAEDRTEVSFRGFVLTETRRAVYMSKSRLPRGFPDEPAPGSGLFLTIQRLSGGITNELFHVFGSSPDAAASSVVVRVFGKETDRVISRESELFYQSLFLETYVHGQNFLIYEFLPQYEPIAFTAMPIHASEIADAAARFQVIATVAAKEDCGKPLLPVSDQTNSELSPHSEDLDCEQLSRFAHERNYTTYSLTKWAELVTSPEIVSKVMPEKQEAFCDVARQLQRECVWILDRVQRVASELAEGVCHNDLLCGNIMRHPTTGDLKIIDFDYAHRNYLLFDAANHFNEYTGLECDYGKYFPDDDAIFHFMLNYRSSMRRYIVELRRGDKAVFDREKEIFWTATEAEEMEVAHRWVGICKLLSLASHVSWAVWSLLQEAVSEIDVDFLDYSKKRFERYLETRDSFTQAE
eukprot:gene8667-6093_t